MYFIFSDGSTAAFEAGARICGLKRNGKRPVSFKLSADEQRRLDDGNKEIREWVNFRVLPALAR